MRTRGVGCVVAVLAGILTGGCGNTGPVPVRGVAAVNGRPLPYGQVLFQPKDPQVGRPAIAKIGRDGRFEAASFAPGDGLMPGHYRIVIDPSRPEFDGEGKNFEAPSVHPKYGNGATSGLTIEVRAGDRPHWLELALDPK